MDIIKIDFEDVRSFFPDESSILFLIHQYYFLFLKIPFIYIYFYITFYYILKTYKIYFSGYR